MLDVIREAWCWTGLDPMEIAATSAFGNVIVKDVAGAYWRICPEDAYCAVIANSTPEYEALYQDSEFLRDWEMQSLVVEANREVGPLRDGYSYCLKVPGAVGGEYAAHNLGAVPTAELLSFSGNLAEQIKDLPDGAEIELKVVD